MTAQIIDEEISRIIKLQYERAIDILKKHKTKLTELANILIEKEVIFEDDLKNIFGERPFKQPEVEVIAKQTKKVKKSSKKEDEIPKDSAK